MIDLCVFVVRFTPSLGGMYLRIHFTHQNQESREGLIDFQTSDLSDRISGSSFNFFVNSPDVFP
ncbi:MAG: hypothetical protein EHM73_10355 [Chroococcales cyanobacterium metabat2.561]|uniref:Uncharacterized protein n=1 Tax=Microcystis aeruginosa Ma_SC_T_19800800_S464 TaxID=2486257 RepID=A0A552DUP7_MICAE|nr:MAG: hypothetical protein EHM73_10355 [Chroococcales cyanobacterium metabat2.561]TRU25911.1 MAG: hypothetical protein EWV81_11150 [Microcystis aeruginosa Ma_SC_T_19800800_S464]